MFERYLSLVALVKMILKQNTKDDWKLLDYKLSALRRQIQFIKGFQKQANFTGS